MAGGTAILRSVARALPKFALRPFGRPVAFHFHGVERRIDDARIQRNHHALDDFYAIAKSLKANFEILPLSALPDVLKHPERHTRTAFLMSDDGYRNTLHVAADVLDGLGLPWSLFVSTHHIDTGELNPLTAARFFLYFAPDGRYAIPHVGEGLLLTTPESRAGAEQSVTRTLRRLDPTRGCEAVDAMFGALPRAMRAQLVERFSSERFLNWPEVAELAKRGVEIGGHAHRHWSMHRGRSVEDLTSEARISKQRIEFQIGSCKAFAYPFGTPSDISRDAWHAVRDVGYSYGFTALAGTLPGNNPWLLPRYGLQAKELGLAALVPMLRTSNLRLAYWQRRMR